MNFLTIILKTINKKVFFTYSSIGRYSRFYEKNGFISIDFKDLPEDFPVLQVDKKFYKYQVVK